jgi:hypothetical protein
MRTSDKILIVVAVLVLAGFSWFLFGWITGPKPVSLSTGKDVDISCDPLQRDIAEDTLIVRDYGSSRAHFKLLASYDVSGLLVGKRRYTKGISARLSPWDYALAWGELPKHMKHLRFKQIVRFCLYQYGPSLPIPPSYIESHMSNNHLIPATPNLRKALARSRKNTPVRLEGYLVSLWVERNGSRTYGWRSSTTREDKGNGACELIYVTRLHANGMVYE